MRNSVGGIKNILDTAERRLDKLVHRSKKKLKRMQQRDEQMEI